MKYEILKTVSPGVWRPTGTYTSVRFGGAGQRVEKVCRDGQILYVAKAGHEKRGRR